MKVYLAGSIPKGDKEKEKSTDWRKEFKEKLSAIEGVEFLDPRDMTEFTEKPHITFGGDCMLIKKSDLIVVFAGEKLGTGTSQEMLIAKYLKKPVITILPKDTHHRRSNIVFEGNLVKEWIHPFIFSTSDLIVERAEDAISWIKEYIINPNSKNIKDITIVDKSITNFEKNVL